MKNIILNGDNLELKNIKDNSIDLIITNPSYGIDYKNNKRNKSERIKIIIVNNQKLKDTWESAFLILNLQEIINNKIIINLGENL